MSPEFLDHADDDHATATGPAIGPAIGSSDDDLDEDLGFEDTEDDTTEAGTGDATSQPRVTARARKVLTKQGAAKAIGKYRELTEAPPKHIALLASALGTAADPADLAATIVSSGRVQLTALNDLIAIVDAAASDPFSAMGEAMKLDRDGARQAWAMLVAADAASGQLPAKDPAAAIEIAKAAGGVGADGRALLDDVRTLARK